MIFSDSPDSCGCSWCLIYSLYCMISCMLCDTKVTSPTHISSKCSHPKICYTLQQLRRKEREGTELRTNKTAGSLIARVASRFLLVCHSSHSSSIELVGSERVAGASDKHSTHQNDHCAESDSGREAVLADECSCDGSPG